MKVLLFSSIHVRDRINAKVMFYDAWDWKQRCQAAFRIPPSIFLMERGTEISMRVSGVRHLFAGIPDSQPYDAKDWSYGVAAFHAGLFYAMQQPFDVLVHLFTDAILGVSLEGIVREFMDRPEVIAGPAWFGRIDTHLIIMKRPAVVDILYSVPFVPLCKTGGNALYYEDALSLVFADKFWNPWPEIKTVRQEYGTPELFKGRESEIMHWPILTKASPEIMARYRETHPLPLKGN